jgi:hypothetical protein
LTTAPELLPCPFCGWEAEVVSGGPGNHFIQCKGCRATSDDRHLDSAIAAWNRREAATALSEAENERLREALTPSGDTKTAYMGEFSFNIEDYDEDGMEWARVVTVPWTTIKEIMAAIRARAALNPKGGDNGEG